MSDGRTYREDVRPPDYRLVTRWSLPAAPDRVWQVLADPDLSWPRWWPGLSGSPSPGPERRASFVLRPARWAYALRFSILIDQEHPPHSATLRVDGDLAGVGLVRIDVAPGGSVLTLDWRVRTTRGWMIRTAPLLAPVFRLAHAHAMRSGARGLRTYLRAADRTW